MFHRGLGAAAAALAVCGATVMLCPPARADDRRTDFGDAGQVVIPDLVGVRSSWGGFLGLLAPPVNPLTASMTGLFGYSHDEMTSTSPPASVSGVPGPPPKTTTGVNVFSVSPSVDVFVTKRVSIGVVTGFAVTAVSHASVPHFEAFGCAHVFQFSVAPRIGYVIPLGHGLSWWPRIGGGVSKADGGMFDGTAFTSTHSTSYAAGIDAGLVYRPLRHVYVAATPEVSMLVYRGRQGDASTYGYGSSGVSIGAAGTVSLGLVL